MLPASRPWVGRYDPPTHGGARNTRQVWVHATQKGSDDVSVCMCPTNVVRLPVGLTDARKALVEALESGNYQHEARSALGEKNLLAIGDVDENDVIRMLHLTRGHQYSSSPHDWDRDTTVHVFKPDVGGERWYVKAYFLNSPVGSAVIISVHQ